MVKTPIPTFPGKTRFDRLQPVNAMQKYAPAVLLASFCLRRSRRRSNGHPDMGMVRTYRLRTGVRTGGVPLRKRLERQLQIRTVSGTGRFFGRWLARSLEGCGHIESIVGPPWYGHVNYTAVADEVPGINRGQEVRFIKIRNFKSPQAPAFPSGMRLSVPADTSLAIKPGDVLCGEGTILPLKAPQRHDTPDFSRINILKGIVARNTRRNISCTGKNTMSLSSLREKHKDEK